MRPIGIAKLESLSQGNAQSMWESEALQALDYIASLERDKARWESRANRYRWALEEHYALFPTGGEKRLAFIELVGKFDDIDSELDAAMAEEGE